MLRINQLKIQAEHTEGQLLKKAAKALRVSEQDILGWEIRRKSVDARKKPELFLCYTLDVAVKGEERVLRALRGREARRGGSLLVERAEDAEYRFPADSKAGGKADGLEGSLADKSGAVFPDGAKPGDGQVHAKGSIVVVGTGPAGLFCGYFLALHGYRPILLERGRDVDARMRDVEAFWQSGRLNPESNVQFGEGGAGTFSDGKLNTLVKDKQGRNRAVLETFVRFGADASILYEAKPHIGTDALTGIVKNMREEIIRLGGSVRFESRVTDVCIREGRVCGVAINDAETLPCTHLALAIGHSARDTFAMLHERRIPMEAKAFAVGFRVEHPQEMINFSQYGRREPGVLGAASYKVAAKAGNGRGVYSFCMCPGGYVVNASSEPGHLAINGMSYSRRDGINANSAIIVAVTPADYGSEHPLAGIAFQRELEKRAYGLGGGRIPAQRYGDFRSCVLGEKEDGIPCGSRWGGVGEHFGVIQPQCKGEFVWADLSGILPKECNQALVEGMAAFGRQIKGFERPDAVLLGVESRTSSPVRICRDESLQSDIRGLYPCGEGAGYAGGILSAAMDGIRVAEAIAESAADAESAY